MEQFLLIQSLITIAGSVIASSGFWAYMQSRKDKKDVSKAMILGLGHDRIRCLGMVYIERGYITQDEYENLYDYLYLPYDQMGGNGSAKRVMQLVNDLPMYKTSLDFDIAKTKMGTPAGRSLHNERINYDEEDK